MTCHDLFELKLYGQVELNGNILALMFTTDPSDVLTLHEFHDTQGLFSTTTAYVADNFRVYYLSLSIDDKFNDHHSGNLIILSFFRILNVIVYEFEQFLLGARTEVII